MINNRLIWLAGKLVKAEDAKINIMSPTCQYGINVFEGIRCYSHDNQLFAFRLDRHIDRLFQSAKILRLKFKYSKEEIKDAFIATVVANKYIEDIAVRIVFFIDEQGSWSFQGECEMMIAPIPMGRAFSSKKSISAGISTWERISDRSVSPRIKAGANYINSRMAQLEAISNNFDTAILLNREGRVSEAPGSCIFIVRDGVLITPPVTASILESITRETIIDISKNNLDLVVIERDIDRTELYISDEIFLCGTAVEIVSVSSVDNIAVGREEVGTITSLIRNKYFEIVRAKEKSPEGWNNLINKES